MGLFDWAIVKEEKPEPAKENVPSNKKETIKEAVKVVEVDQTHTIRTPQMVDLTGIQHVQVNDQEYVEMLNNKLNEAAQKNTSFDFMKFIASTTALQSVIPDETSRIKAVFATNQVTAKTTLDQIIQSADSYIQVVEDIQGMFDSWAEDFNKTELLSRESKIAKIQAEKDNKKAQIEKLSAEIAELSTQEANFHAEVQANTAILQGKKVAFASAKGKIQGNLTSLRDNIKKTLT